MASKDKTVEAVGEEFPIVIEDAAELTEKELAQERKAALDERQRRSWLTHTPEQLAERIPVSVFAMGQIASS